MVDYVPIFVKGRSIGICLPDTYHLCMRSRRSRTLKDIVFPHSGNNYKPLALTTGGIACALSAIVLVQSVYVLGSHLVRSNPHFLASVLPSVVTQLTNEDRRVNGLALVETDTLLTRAAQMKAQDMAEKGYFAHIAPDGKTPWYWLDRVQYPYSYAGENLAIDFVDSQDVEDAWMASPTHRANIVKREYMHIGVGVARGMYEGVETTFVVQFFATPRKGAALPAEATVATAAPGARVLGAYTTPLDTISFVDFLARLAASPMHTTAYILAGLAGLFALLLIIAIVVHVRMQYIEVIAGGLLVVIVALGMIAWNALSAGVPNIAPHDSATASRSAR